MQVCILKFTGLLDMQTNALLRYALLKKEASRKTIAPNAKSTAKGARVVATAARPVAPAGKFNN